MRYLAVLCFVGVAFGQAVRVDPEATFTTQGGVPPGARAPVLAVPGSAISVCNDAGCAAQATTYTDISASTPCPSNAQVVQRGGATCSSSSNAQGNFGFWVLPGTYYYRITFPNGAQFGNYPVSASAGGGGGGGSPGTPANSFQYNCAGSFCGTTGMLWNSSTKVASLAGNPGTPSITVTGGYIQSDGGFAAITSANYNSIQSVLGGVKAISGTFGNYIQPGSYTGATAAGPTISVGDSARSGALSYSTVGGCIAVFNGSTWACLSGSGSGANTALSNLAGVSINTALLFQTTTSLGSAAAPPQNLFLYGSGTYGSTSIELTGTPTGNRVLTLPDRTANMATSAGSLTNGHCVSIDSSGNFVDAGGACTTGGGGGTVSAGTSPQLAYYTGATTVASMADFSFASHTITSGASGILDLHSAATSGFFLPGGLSTGPLKVTTSTGAVSTASSTDIIGLWSGTCNSTTVLRGDGTCATGTGIASINSQTGPAFTLTQTTNQVLIAIGSNSATFSLPQDIATSSSVQFGGLKVSGTTLLGLGSSDVSIIGSGGLITGNTVAWASATTNASVGSINIVPASYFAIGTNHTGSGLTLPVSLFVGNVRALTVDTTARVLVNRTSDDGSGSEFQVSGDSSLAGNVRPTSSLAYDFGGSSLRWKTMYGQTLDINAVATGQGAAAFLASSSSNAAVVVNNGGSNWGVADLSTFGTLVQKLTVATGPILDGLSSSDVTLSGNGGLITNNSIAIVTGTANASVGSFNTIASNYVAFSSGKTGSGTVLPMAFFVGATRAVNIDTAGKLLVGYNSSISGDLLQVNGGIKVNSCVGCGGGGVSSQSGNLGSSGTGTRATGVVYHNVTGGPIFVTMSLFYFGGGTGSFQCVSDSGSTPTTVVTSEAITSGLTGSMSFWVLVGNYYSCGAGGSVAAPTWVEWN